MGCQVAELYTAAPTLEKIRRICRKCGAIYHLKNMPSKQEGICDQCQGELYQRADDNEETIKKRMAVYEENTAPIIDYYKEQ